MIPAERAHLNVAAVSHPGMSGKNNEDRYSVSAFSTTDEPPLPSLLAIIADGIGGHRAGEIAAEIAIETISQVVAASDGSQPERILQEAIQRASQAIYQQAQNDLNQRGMGSTCACCWIVGERLHTATVGDSRIYLVRNGVIQQISTDHTWVQEAIDQGSLAPGQAKDHPNAHVIRRYLGSRQPVIPDMRLKLNSLENDRQAETNQGFTLKPGDRMLLCSDGLTDLVEDHEILGYLQTRTLDAALEQLVMLSNQRGGHDNITIIAIQFPEELGSQPPGLPQKKQARSRVSTCAIILSIGVVIALLIGSLSIAYWNMTGPKQTMTPSTLLTSVPETIPASGNGLTSTAESSGTQYPAPTMDQTLPSRSTPIWATLTPWPTNTPNP